MSRLSLGHTAHDVRLLFALLLGALLRVPVTRLAPGVHLIWVAVSGLLQVSAFCGFAVR
jgi:hypothetical protein